MERMEFINPEEKKDKESESQETERLPKSYWLNHLRLAFISLFLLVTPNKESEATAKEELSTPTSISRIEGADVGSVEVERRKSFEAFKDLVETEKIKEKIEFLKKELGSSIDNFLTNTSINKDLQILSRLTESEDKSNSFVKDGNINLMTSGSIVDNAFKKRWVYQPKTFKEVTFSGIESVPGVSVDDLKYFLGSHYPSNYVNHSVLAIEYSNKTEVTEVEGQKFQTLGQVESRGLTSMSKNVSGDGRMPIKINLPATGATESYFVEVLTHEINHCSDWINNPSLTSAERISMFYEVYMRSQSEDRYKFDYVEGIDLSRVEMFFQDKKIKSEEEKIQTLRAIKVNEYWAEVAKRYFQNPETLEQDSPEDYKLVKKWVGIMSR